MRCYTPMVGSRSVMRPNVAPATSPSLPSLVQPLSRKTFLFLTHPNQSKAPFAHRIAPLTCTSRRPSTAPERDLPRIPPFGERGIGPPCQTAHHTRTSGGSNAAPKGDLPPHGTHL